MQAFENKTKNDMKSWNLKIVLKLESVYLCLVYLLATTTTSTTAATSTTLKLTATSSTPSDESIGTYPTNFMKDIVPSFRNVRPVIGILTIVGDGDHNPFRDVDYLKNKSYVGTSCVKFLEAAGARVVPIVEVIETGNNQK